MELADQQSVEAEGALSGAEIPAVETPSPAGSTPAQEKPLSIREQLNKSIETVRTEEAKRARDVTTGKFAKTEASAEKPAAEKPTTEIPKVETKPEASASPAEPPSAWKSIWDNLTPEAKAIAVKREAEVAKGFDEYRGKVKNYDAIEQVIAPVRARFQQMGVQNDAQALHNIFTWEAALNNPATSLKAFRDLAQRIGVDLSTLAQNPSSASPAQEIPEPIRPVLDQFGNDLNAVKQEIQNFRGERISQVLSSFAKDKPHFEKVRVIMGQLMQAGLAGDLEGAYQKATMLHPEVAAQIKADMEAKAKTEADRTQAEKAKNARLAAVSPSGRSPNGAPVNGGPAKASNGVRGDILSAVAALREGQRA